MNSVLFFFFPYKLFYQLNKPSVSPYFQRAPMSRVFQQASCLPNEYKLDRVPVERTAHNSRRVLFSRKPKPGKCRHLTDASIVRENDPFYLGVSPSCPVSSISSLIKLIATSLALRLFRPPRASSSAPSVRAFTSSFLSATASNPHFDRRLPFQVRRPAD